jgi:hypothetical protein
LSSIENQFLEAERSAQDVVALTDAISRLPDANRRQLVFLALNLVEGGKASTSTHRNGKATVAAVPAARPVAAAPSPAPAKSGVFKTRGARRSQAEVDAQANALHAEIARGAGRGIEALAKALGTTTQVLALPMTNLLEDGRVTKVGRLRGTKYSAGKPVGTSAAPAKTASPKNASAPKKSAPVAASKRPSRGRGSSVSVDVVLAEVKRQGGRSSEAIAKSLKVAPRQLRSSLVKLIEAKKIKTKGKKRGMRYTAA